ncbi:molybdopterin converting factor subunit 1 [Marinobacterium lutimaris]|uniref:Molybdopterin synthase sulfur carrier subunit n=1 Tax=Marinobacterium lutimaris TaxID=568106 RepID=A0A1H6CW55_9GAMM|nr:molybdopterin converting factor subunit 1 [Marinobacterium lutimaris]SEG77232.1 molybdopterin synthase subunit MoaD [Marinobacterium lutimaris]
MKLVYFASVREQLGTDEEQLELPAGVDTLADLIAWLRSERGEPWESVLGNPRLLCAVNQEMSTQDAAITQSDEVAFFPPVTGG